MKRIGKRNFGLLCFGTCFFLATILEVSWGQTEQALGRPQAPRQASAGGIPHKSVKAAALKWKDEEQKKSCETKAAKLREHFLKAREFSIQGDSCSSEQEARSFGEKFEELKKDCPGGFPEQAGFTPKVVRNVKTIQSLGKERCLSSEKPVVPNLPKAAP